MIDDITTLAPENIITATTIPEEELEKSEISHTTNIVLKSKEKMIL